MSVSDRLLILGCALVPIALAGCGGESAGSSSAGSSATPKASVEAPPSIHSAGAIRFCTDPTYPPAEFKTGNDLDGFDIEIAEAVAGSMGVDSTFVETGFDGIIAALQGRKCDALIAAMRKDDTAMRDAVQRSIDTLYGDGTMEQIFGRWDVPSFSLQ
jgi:ABC-type amino acid transport substrate-binding protein